MVRGRSDRAESKPLYSESAERAVIGVTLSDSSKFWDVYGKLKPHDFAVPRMARIWAAMCRAGEAGKPVNRNYTTLFISGDGEENTPLPVLLGALINDAPENAADLDAYVETISHLSNKRSLLDALDSARTEIMSIDAGVPLEDMQDKAVRAVTSSIAQDFDRDMKSYFEWGKSLEHDVFEAYNAGEEGGVGLPCGLRAVEEVMGRLLPGKVYVVAGMASAGKSALVRQIAEAASVEAARRKIGWGYIASLEMTGEDYATRYIAQQLGIPGDRIDHGNLNSAEVEALSRQVQRLKDYPIIIDTRARLDMETIRARMMRVKNRNGLSFGVIDHLLLIRGGKRDSMMERVSDATIEAKNLAKEFGIPMLILSQLNEKAILERPSGWPNPADLFGGQAIQQNTDVTMFVHRPEKVTERKEPPKTQSKKEGELSPHQKWVERMDRERGVAYVFNQKRRGGAGNVKRELSFDGPTMSFRDV